MIKILSAHAVVFMVMINLVKGEQQPLPGLIVKTHVYIDGVALRWTPVNIYNWRKWHKEGYKIERYTIGRDGLPLVEGESLLLGGGIIKSMVGEAWDKYKEIEPSAYLIEQCLLKESTVRIENKEKYLNTIEAEEQCYVLSMLAMQKSFDLALAAGIGFVDNAVKSNEVYLYKIYPVNGSTRDTQRIVIDMKEITVLPQIKDFTASMIDNRFNLQWPGSKYKEDYFGFQIEKSIDSGRTYFPLHEMPILLSNSEFNHEIYSDSISEFNRLLLYRIKGMSYFGQYGIPSFSDTVMAFFETAEFPKYLEVAINQPNVCDLSWSFESYHEKYIQGFRLYSSESADGTYTALDSEILTASERIRKLIANKVVLYLKVAAITLNNHSNFSLPIMVQFVDSIPPVAPVLIGVDVDSTGVAAIVWHRNTESDIMGYRVYRGNSRTSEFSNITASYYIDSTLYDTLYTGMLRDSIYYKVIAVDDRFNESEYSEIMAAPVTDKIEPEPPSIYKISTMPNQASLHWYQSGSKDVAFYNILRQSSNSSIKDIIPVDKNLDNYRDTLVLPGNTYQYSLQAIDHSGLKSKISNTYEVKIPSLKVMPEVSVELAMNDTSKNCLTIFWRYSLDSDVSHYRIIQQMADGGVKTIGTASSGSRFYIYHYLKPYTMTNYKIIAYFKDGRRSRL